MKTPKMRRLVGALAVSTLVLAACSGDSDSETDGSTEASSAGDESTSESEGSEAAATTSDAVISTYIGQPESLTPTNNTESEGNAVLSAVFTQLIAYDAASNYEPMMANAESIETEDNVTYTVTLKEGWTFHDGSPVTAQAYVDAWNYASFGPNAQSTSGFFSPIAGYTDLQCGTTTQANEETGEDEEVADCDGAPPAAETMSGLTVDSETEFTIELAQEEPFFVTRLGYPAYSPMPEAFYDDPEAFDRAPIGNGPFMMDGEWQDDVGIMTTAFPDYAGDQQPQVGGIEFRIYADVNTAVTDLVAGNLDIVDSVPPEQWESTISQVPNSDTSESSSITYIGFPTYVEPFDDPNMRAALSMAIDREAITTGVFDGLNQPAQNILTPVIPGYEEEVCEEWTYSPDAAVQRFEEAGGVEALGDTLEVWFNEGSGHDVWVNAVVTQWDQVLGIPADSVEFQQLPFAEYLEIADTQQMTGPFRLGWGMDYPHPQNYLQILLELTVDEGGNNATFWQNDEYSAKIDEALAVTDVQESLPLWQEAAAIACGEAPSAPVYYGLNKYAWNDTVSNVSVDAFGNLDYLAVSAAG